MSKQNLDVAHKFAELVGAGNLLEYLGLEQSASSEEVRAKLREKRKYMQGMQSNPKYKTQALFLIKNFGALDEVLTHPLAYLDDARRRQESEHLPVLEMTIKGVLKGGPLKVEQAEFLKHQATELGISEQTYQETLERISTELGVDAPLPELSEAEKGSNHYAVLGVTFEASRDIIYDAYRDVYREAKATPQPAAARTMMEAADQAWRVLGDPRTREAYDISQENTAPPNTSRVTMAQQALTAPPVRPRASHPQDPQLGPRLEIFGEPARDFAVGSGPVGDQIRLRTAIPMTGFITSTAPEWLKVEPAHLTATVQEQILRVTVLPDFEGAVATGAIHIVTERGDRAQIVFEAHRQRFSPLTVGIAVMALVILAIAIGLGSMTTIQAGGPPGLTIHINPSADDVLLNGQSMGNGSAVFVPNPPTGTARLRVSQRNFRTYEREITIPPDQPLEVPVVLELTEAMDFRPADGMIQGTLDQEVVQRVMKPRSKAMDTCIADEAEPGSTMSGTVRIHIRQSGRAQGVEMEGDGISNPRIRTCLTRQAAAVYIHPLEEGDYATVRYDYQVTP